MDNPDSDELRGYGEHAPALWRYALLLTGDSARATHAVQETLLRARRDAEISNGASSSARARLFTAARNMIIDQQRSAGLPTQRGAADSAWPDHAGPEEVNAAVDRLLLGDALAQLPVDHRTVLRFAYYQGCTTAQIAADLDVAEETVKSRLHDAVRTLWLQLHKLGIALQ
jgi:RNA polymerase sigma-70 factor (ECF subfamily)